MKPITHPLAIAAAEAQSAYWRAGCEGPVPADVVRARDAAEAAWQAKDCPLYAEEVWLVGYSLDGKLAAVKALRGPNPAPGALARAMEAVNAVPVRLFGFTPDDPRLFDLRAAGCVLELR